MEYQLNLGTWNSVFAVPGVLVDQHLKLAGAAQLKVILWVLRHAGENFSVSTIAQALSMHEADVRDSMQYWVETGVICRQEHTLAPSAVPLPAVTPEDDLTLTEEGPVSATVPAASPVPKVPASSTAPVAAKAGTKRALSRPEKPDMKYLNKRMDEDESIAFLMQSADEIFGRMTSNNDKETLLLIHEYDGLPVEVLIMLLQYAVSIGKGSMRYIEKMAIDWADHEITTLEAADRKIQQLTRQQEACYRVQRLFGVADRAPSEQERIFFDQWVVQWQLSDELLKAAYDVCIGNKGKYIPKYINTTLENWYSAGITEVSQIPGSSNKTGTKKAAKGKGGYQPGYNIDEYESTSVLDEEWNDD